MQSLSSSLRQSFLAGVLVILPIYITWKVMAVVFSMVDGPLGTGINAGIRAATGSQIHIPGLGVLATVAIVLLAGWLTRRVFFKRALVAFEAFLLRIPIVRSLYNASRQIVSPFADETSKLPFSKVILAEYPMKGRFTVGLLAKETVSDEPEDDRCVVFFPSNHLHLGYPVILSRHEVHVIDMSVEEAVKFFVSCGVIGDDKLVRHHGKLLGLADRAH